MQGLEFALGTEDHNEMKAALEAAQSEIAKMKKDHDLERDKMKRVLGDMKKKMDRAVKEKQKMEAALAEANAKADAATAGATSNTEDAILEAKAQAEAELTSLKSELSLVQERLLTASGTIVELQNELNDHKEQSLAETCSLSSAHQLALQELRQELAAAQVAASQADAERRAIESDFQQLKEQFDTSSSAYEHQLGEMKQQLKEAAAAAEDLDSLKARCAHFEEQLFASDSSVKQLQEELSKQQQHASTAAQEHQIELKEVKDQLAPSQASISQFDAECSALSAQLQESKLKHDADIAQYEDQLSQLKQQLENVAKASSEPAEVNGIAETEVSRVKTKLNAVQKQLSSSTARIEQLEDEAKDLQQQLIAQTSELTTVHEQTLQELEGKLATAQAAVAQAEAERSSVAGHLQELSDKHEAAVEKYEKELIALQQVLEGQSTTAIASEDNVEEQEEVLGLKAEVSAMQEKLSAANSSIDELQHQLDEYRDQSAAESSDLAAAHEHTLQELKEMKQKLEEAQAIVLKVETERDALGLQLQELGNQLDTAVQSREMRSLQLAKEIDNKAALLEVNASTQAEVLRLTDEVSAMQEKLSAANSSIDELQHQLDEYRDQSAAESSDLAAAHEHTLQELKEMKQKLEEAQASVSHAQAEQAALDTQLQEVQQHMHTLLQQHEAQLTDLKQQLDDKTATAGAATREVEQWHSQYDTTKKQLDDALQSIEDLRHQLSEADKHTATLKSQLATVKEEYQVFRDVSMQQSHETNSETTKWMRLFQEKESELDELTRKLDKREHDIAAAEEKVEALRTKHKKERETMDADYQEQMKELREEVEAKEKKIAYLHSQEEHFTAQLAQAVEQQKKLQELSMVQKALEAAKGDIAKLKKEQEMEREKVKRVVGDMKKKMDRAMKDKQKAETTAAEATAKAGTEVSTMRTELTLAEEKLSTAMASIHQLENELKDYKARSHALLKSKDSELKMARECSVQELKLELMDAQAALATADAALKATQEQLQEVTDRFTEQYEGAVSRYESQLTELNQMMEDRDTAAQTATRASEQWRRRYESLHQQYQEATQPVEQLRQRLAEAEQQAATLEAQLKQVKDEYQAFRDTTLQLAEAKDAEVSRLLELNSLLRNEMVVPKHLTTAGSVASGMSDVLPQLASSRRSISDIPITAESIDSLPRYLSTRSDALPGVDDVETSSLYERRSATLSASELDFDAETDTRIVKLSERQADRERELAGALRRQSHLEFELNELEKELELHHQQERALKDALRDMEREVKRVKTASSGVDMEYLKNVILKLFQTGEKEALLPVVGMVLQFSPAELKRCKDAIEAERAALDTANEGGGVVDAHSGDVTAYLSNFTKSWLGS